MAANKMPAQVRIFHWHPTHCQIGIDRCTDHATHFGWAARLLPFMLWQL